MADRDSAPWWGVVRVDRLGSLPDGLSLALRRISVVQVMPTKAFAEAEVIRLQLLNGGDGHVQYLARESIAASGMGEVERGIAVAVTLVGYEAPGWPEASAVAVGLIAPDAGTVARWVAGLGPDRAEWRILTSRYPAGRHQRADLA